MTDFYLIDNIQFTSDYTDVVDFTDIAQQRLYFQQRRVNGYDTSVQHINPVGKSFVVKIEQEVVQNYSYISFVNRTLSGESKTFYAFILNVDFVDKNSCRIVYKLDVYQTYQFNFQLKDCFVDREHQDRFYKENNNFIPIWNEELENIEVGEDLQIISRERIKDKPLQDFIATQGEIKNLANQVVDFNITWFMIITSELIANNVLHYSFSNISNGYYVYLIPYVSEVETTFYGTFGDKTSLLFSLNDESKLLENEKIVSVRYLPYSPIQYTITNGYYLASGLHITLKLTGGIPVELKEEIGFNVSKGKHIISVREIQPNTMNTDLKTFNLSYPVDTRVGIPTNIEHEIKLKTFPYRSYIISNYQIEPLLVKEENIQNTTLKVISSLDINGKTKIYLDNYLGDNGKQYCSVETKLNELTLMNDAFRAYMASNRATATTGIAVNTGMGVAGTLLAIGGIATGGMGIPLGMMALGVGLNSGKQIYGELLKQSNLKQTPDAVKDMGNNIGFDIVDGNLTFEVVKREIKPIHKEKLYQFLLRYGYKTNRFKTPQLRTRYYYNYIRCIDVNLTGNINNDIKAQLKNIFNNGVTLWHFRNVDPNLYDYSLENIETSLI